MTATHDSSVQNKLRAALRYSTGDPASDELMRGSIRAGIVGNDLELMDVYEQEVGPEQAEVDLHLDGPGVDEHATSAKRFADFIAGISEAVKETAKHRAGKGRYTEGLLIEGATPGSVRVVLKAPRPKIDPDATIDERTSASSVDSDALRSIAAILTHASDPEPDSPLVAEIADLPPRARDGLRRAIRSSRKAGWIVDGTMRQRRIGLQPIHLSSDGATRLSIELDSRIESTRQERLVGRIDGFRRSLGTIYFAPEGRAIITAGVIESEITTKVTELFTDPDAEIEAVFNVVESRLPGDKSQVRTSRTLTSIRRTEKGEQGHLFPGRMK